ncbi:hypothetical protein Q3G72_019442 [Acer saccharum]|nr:hypothetical protein Q3G72_019442 [Acer saccharum]
MALGPYEYPYTVDLAVLLLFLLLDERLRLPRKETESHFRQTLLEVQRLGEWLDLRATYPFGGAPGLSENTTLRNP